MRLGIAYIKNALLVLNGNLLRTELDTYGCGRDGKISKFLHRNCLL